MLREWFTELQAAGVELSLGGEEEIYNAETLNDWVSRYLNGTTPEPTNEYGIRQNRPIVDYDIPDRIVSELLGDKTHGWRAKPDADETLQNMKRFYDWWEPRMSDFTRKNFFEDLPKVQQKVWDEQEKAHEYNFDYIYESGVESWKYEHQDDDPEPEFPEDPYSDPAFMRGYEEAERETMDYGGVGEALMFINELIEYVNKSETKESAFQKHAI